MRRRIVITITLCLLLAVGYASECEAQNPDGRPIIPTPTRNGVVLGDEEQQQNNSSCPDADAQVLAVTFAANSATLTQESKDLLVGIATNLNAPAFKRRDFRVQGYTALKGSDAANQKLSEERAKAVMDELTKPGRVEAKRLESRGYGASCLVDKAHPKAGINQRVVLERLN